MHAGCVGPRGGCDVVIAFVASAAAADWRESRHVHVLCEARL